MTVEFATVKDNLAGLNKEELTTVINTCSTLVQGKKGNNIRKQMVLYKEVQDIIWALTGVWPPVSFHHFAKTRDGALLQPAVEYMDTIIRNAVGALPRAEERRAVQVMVGLIGQHQEQFCGIISVTRVLQRTADLSTIINNAFPGYIASGLGHAIFHTSPSLQGES